MNFDFLKPVPQLGKLYQFCNEAEALVGLSPASSVTSSRKALEYVVRLVYGAKIDSCDGLTLFEMMDDSRFVAFIDDEVTIDSMHTVRKMGNVAAHGGDMSVRDAVAVLEQMHFIVGEVCITLGVVDDYPVFAAPGSHADAPPAKTPAKPAAPAATPAPPKERVVVEPEVIAEFAPRMRHARFSVAHGRDEGENKRLFLAASLREAGWALVNVPNQAMPACAGIQCMLEDGEEVDYVLYGRDNRPLAIVDYTTMMSKGPIAARMRVEAVTAKMAVTLGYKPIAYYTNGYQIFCIDQLGYPARRVFDFHTIDELELLKQRAGSRQDITNPSIRDEVTNRDYQKDAVRSVCAAFTDMRRRSLLVMATGTGKTRVSISLADVLLKSNWAKNILFLADRNSLVRQAHKSFNKLLPNVPTSIYAGSGDERDPNARIIFSTYQTMINLINDDSKEFTIGRFDLIIIDEAHRSIFKKYGAIFNYFDALMVGLTATPRCEENKSTYQVFDLPAGEPDCAYELEEAIQDGYLVGFQVLDRTTELIRRGIRYDELSEEEKEQFEDAFVMSDDEEESATDFSGAELPTSLTDKRVINVGTIREMLGDLVKNGLKIDAGDKLGKTFIFAKSHKEAEVIAEQFQKIYGYMGADFCKVIDSKVENSQSLIDSFGERDAMPQVAVSVDMLDTGIDVPDAVNLVFFKSVHSKIKFLQMLGRGTRLSPDLFGPGVDKQGFLVFDYFDNFRYFSTTGTWSMVDYGKGEKGMEMTPQSVLVNKNKLDILRQLDEGLSSSDFDVSYREQIREYFVVEVRSLSNDDVQVQYGMSYVSKYRTEENWHNISDEAANEIAEHILPLIPAGSEPVKVRNFDALMYTVEAAYMRRKAEGKDPRKIRHGFYNVCNEFTDRMEALLKLKTIPDVMAKEPLIISMIDGDYLMDDFSLEKAESVRRELRGLMQYIPDDRRYYVVDFADKIIDADDDPQGFVAHKPYPAKAMDYVNGSGNPSLMKLRNLDALDDAEKQELRDVFTAQLGGPADYAAWSGNADLLPFLRKQVGIADEAVETKFGSFLNRDTLGDVQFEIMSQMVTYARENGDITAKDLMNVSPFSDVDFAATFGPGGMQYVKQLIDGLHHPVM